MLAGHRDVIALQRAAAKPPARGPLDLSLQWGDLTSNGNNDPSRIDLSLALVQRNWSSSPQAGPFRCNGTGGGRRAASEAPATIRSAPRDPKTSSC